MRASPHGSEAPVMLWTKPQTSFISCPWGVSRAPWIPRTRQRSSVPQTCNCASSGMKDACLEEVIGTGIKSTSGIKKKKHIWERRGTFFFEVRDMKVWRWRGRSSWLRRLKFPLFTEYPTLMTKIYAGWKCNEMKWKKVLMAQQGTISSLTMV